MLLLLVLLVVVLPGIILHTLILYSAIVRGRNPFAWGLLAFVHLWSTQAKHAVIMRLPSSTLPRPAAYFSDSTTRSYRSWPTLWPR